MQFNWKIKKTWPKRWPAKIYEPDDPALDPLVSRLRKNYKSLIAYHGCRTLDTAPYYANGLLVADHQVLLKKAILFYCNLEEQAVTEAQVINAYQVIKENAIDDKKCYLVLDDRYLIDYCGHYLIYGSEFLIAIGAGLQRETGFDYRQLLKKLGIPTVFVCDVPLSILSDYTLRELAAGICASKFEKSEGGVIDFSVILHSGLPAKCVQSHFHPRVIPDPLIPYGKYIHEN